MTHIRLTNPNSFVQVAMYAFVTYEAVAAATGTTVKTVMQWRFADKIPTKHQPVIAAHACMDLIALYNYCESRRYTKPKVKSAGVVDALITGEAHPEVDDVRRKQLLTLWGDRLEVLRDVFSKLEQPFDNQEDYGKAVREAAETLGISVPHVYRLMRLFSVARKPFATTKVRESLHKEARKHAESCANAAISAVKGQNSVAKLSKEVNISARQMFRHVDKTLTNYPGSTLQVLSRYPKYFRMAVADEVLRKDHGRLSLRLKAVYDEFPPKGRYKPPKNLKRAGYKDKFIAVLSAETTVHDLSILADAPTHVIDEAFNRYCVPFGLSWPTLRGQSVYHQAFFAEILKGSGNDI